MHPGLTINDITYRGYLEGKDVHDAICTSFDSHRPDACKAKVDKHFTDTDEELSKKEAFEKATEEKNALYKAQERRKVRKVIVWLILGFLVAVQLVFFCWYRRKRQQEINQRMQGTIDEAIVEYMRVQTSQDDQSSSQVADSSRVNNQA